MSVGDGARTVTGQRCGTSSTVTQVIQTLLQTQSITLVQGDAEIFYNVMKYFIILRNIFGFYEIFYFIESC